MADLTFDDSSFKKGAKDIINRVEKKQIDAIRDIADELLRLSQLEVPFDVGFLMQSANSERDGEEYIVGYNTPYAAKLHEHPQYKFKNGRKGKYLEDPMKHNLKAFIDFFNDRMGEVYA